MSNFTPGGFGTNTELNVVVIGNEDDEFFRTLDLAISDYWSRAEPLTPQLFDQLAQAWASRSRPSRSSLIGSVRKVVRPLPSQLLDVSWAGYVALLEDQCRRHPNLRLSSLNASQHTYLGEARQAREAFEKEPKFARMKRTDLFFTVNKGNHRRMREMLGVVPRNADEYVEALELLRTYPWYRANKPPDEYQRELWRSRVGLIDAVLYEPA